jgi:putative ABC transport system permease protein
MSGRLIPSHLNSSDVLRVAAAGLHARPVRVLLSALGIAIGIGAMVAVVGISVSSQARLDATLSRLGTNMLTVSAGKTLSGQNAELPTDSVSMVARIAPVLGVSATGRIDDQHVYRNDHIPTDQSGGIAVLAARVDLPGTVGTSIASGTWLNAATDRYPAVVLGADTASVLGIGRAGTDIQVWLGSRWFTVIGILNSAPLAPELDNAALIGWPAAQTLFRFDGHPSTIYERSTDSSVTDVRDVLARTVNPQDPEEVAVGRPSDALAAQVAANESFAGLLLGVGAVALLVGGIGVANTMVISVLERRSEIGLRRALGATRGMVRRQFFTEALLLSVLGGVAGVVIGSGVTAGYAVTRQWPVVVPVYVVGAALAATVLIGAVAGLYPAMRAAALPPTAALTAE